MSNPIDGFKLWASASTKTQRLRTAFAKALKTPYNKGLWDEVDKVDKALWELNIHGPRADTAKWDNRRKRV